jgi:hypothetical protein
MGKIFSRTQAKELFHQGWGIIDTSGRTRSLKEKSVIALVTNKIEFSILFEAHMKRRFFEIYNSNYSKEHLLNLLHSIGLFILVKDYIENIPGIFICADGFNPGRLKHNLGNFLRNKDQIQKIHIFSSLKPILGKKNPADRLAYFVNKQNRNPTKRLTLLDLQRFLKK